MNPSFPLERFHALPDIPEAGYETDITATPEERKRLAEWAGLDEVSQFSAHVRVRKQSKTRFLLEADFTAEVVQSCVVTLEPVSSHIAKSFTRLLHLGPVGAHGEMKGQVAPADDEAPEEINSPRYDLAEPLREEFALAIDPYPRAPGVEFEPPGDGDKSESPFAILGSLRRRE